VGLMAWFPRSDFIQVLDGCSACAGRAAVALARARPSHASPEMGPNQLALLLLNCPWGGSGCYPECVASGSRWGEAWLVARKRAGPHAQQGSATEASSPSPSAISGPARCRGTMHELPATRMVDSGPMVSSILCSVFCVLGGLGSVFCGLRKVRLPPSGASPPPMGGVEEGRIR